MIIIPIIAVKNNEVSFSSSYEANLVVIWYKLKKIAPMRGISIFISKIPTPGLNITITPINPKYYLNISPEEGITFAIFQSINNI